VLVVPIGVVTPMFLIPVVAVLNTLSVTVIVVGLTVKLPAAALTPLPSPVNPVAPVKFVPVMVTGIATVPVDGWVAEFGLIEAIVGPCTVNGSGLLAVVAPATVTVTLRVVSAAAALIVKVAVICVELTTVMPLTVIPVPLTATVV
jgi:hypothetical protein